jgi:hypothetical protein
VIEFRWHDLTNRHDDNAVVNVNGKQMKLQWRQATPNEYWKNLEWDTWQDVPFVTWRDEEVKP